MNSFLLCFTHYHMTFPFILSVFYIISFPEYHMDRRYLAICTENGKNSSSCWSEFYLPKGTMLLSYWRIHKIPLWYFNKLAEEFIFLSTLLWIYKTNFQGWKSEVGDKLDLYSLLHLCIKNAQRGFLFHPVNCFPFYCVFIEQSGVSWAVFLLLLCFSFWRHKCLFVSHLKKKKSTEGVKFAPVHTYILTIFQVFR